MTLIYGKRVAKIKEFTDHSHNCTSCKAFDLRVKVFREYYHAFFIPFVAFGDKTADIRCNQCTEPIRTEALKKEFEKNTKTPFYMYSLAILVAGVIAFFIILSLVTTLQTKSYIANPQAGDVYLVHEKEGLEGYSYLRVAAVKGDTIMVYRNHVRYVSLDGAPDKFSDEDYFVEDHFILFTKATLKQMLSEDEITVAKRYYDNETGFNRVNNEDSNTNE
jgi:hypothetical protein